MVITVNSIKGGVGKSTIATNLAVWLHLQGKEVLLVDADDQETASDFTTWRENSLGSTGYTLVNMIGSNLRKQVTSLRSKYDFIIIDTGGRDTTSQRAALAVTDISLLPMVPRSFDLWTIDKMVDLINEINDVRPEEIKAYAFLSKADVRSADNREVVAALQEESEREGAPFVFLDTPITNRKAISNSASAGMTVFEVKETDPKAIMELENLFKSVLEDGNK